jgi:short-subunit dehydrogenase
VTPWRRALLTGASSGIGEAFADELASVGVDLILVGRAAAALDAVAARAHGHGVEALALCADLAVAHDVTRVSSMIAECDPMIDLLVNAAGAGWVGQFAGSPLAGSIEMMRVNNEALVQLTHAALSRMVQAGRGSLIQISSTASAGPGPGQAIYAATKAFVTSFGQAISVELMPTGVTCTTVLPGYTRTRWFERVGIAPDIADARWMTAEQVARVAIDAARRGRAVVIPGAGNRWRVALASPFPSLAKGRVLGRARQTSAFARRTIRRADPRT